MQPEIKQTKSLFPVNSERENVKTMNQLRFRPDKNN